MVDSNSAQLKAAANVLANCSVAYYIAVEHANRDELDDVEYTKAARVNVAEAYSRMCDAQNEVARIAKAIAVKTFEYAYG